MFLVLTVLMTIPPLLSLMACSRWRKRVVGRGHSGQWPLAGMILSVAVLIINVAILGQVGLNSAPGVSGLKSLHAVALCLSWLCLWVWLYVLFAHPRRRILY
ncbi:MAG: hypothetical protein OEY05_01565 [Paracoccaceae bacterium]|nr:hypothetical protein [Paracoccaceae bacterium]